MATDTTNLPQDMGSAENDGGTQFDAVQLAQASPAAQPVQVAVPAGANVVRVPVTPGAVIELPFEADAKLLGKLGDNGNLAIKVGDVTVILEGYANATGQQDVIVEANDGKPLDVATILAATDPNLDIQTAAGDAVGAQGADNTGAIFGAFGAGQGIGGFNAIGAQAGTELQYGLIDAERKLFLEDNGELDTSPSFPHNPSGNIADVLFNEDDLTGGRGNDLSKSAGGADFDGNDEFDARDNDEILPGNIPDFNKEPVDTTVEINVNFKGFGPGTLELTDTGLAALGLTSDGSPLHYVLSDNGRTLTAVRDSDGSEIFKVHVEEDSSGGTFHVDVALLNRLDHPLTDNPDTLPVEEAYEDLIALKVHAIVTNSKGQSTEGTIGLTLEDDVPVIGADHQYQSQQESLLSLSPTGLDLSGYGISDTGGIVLDIVGVNGQHVVVQLAASSLFKGFFDLGTPVEFLGDPGTIGKQGGFTAEVLEQLGGGIAEMAVRVTVYDGDNAVGEFDHNDNTLLLNGKEFGNFSDVDTGAPGGGFRSETLDTGWFHVVGDSPKNIDLLNDIYNSLTPTGELVLQLHDDNSYPLDDPKYPGLDDNGFDFTQGGQTSLPPDAPLIIVPAVAESDIGSQGGSLYGSFDFQYGADGPADGNLAGGEGNEQLLPQSPLSLKLEITDPEDGSVWTDKLKSGGDPVTITEDHEFGQTILTGKADGGPVFVITVNDLTGDWSATFEKPLDHPDAGVDGKETGGNDTFQFKLTATITDDDGDKATGSQSFVLLDDGPSTEAPSPVPNTLLVDETDLSVDAKANFSGLFSASYGADGPGKISDYVLGVSAPGGVDSGLVETKSGHGVYLFEESGEVVGREGTSAADAAGGDIIFVVSVDKNTGEVTLDQQAAVVHPDANNPDNSKGLLSADLITLSATVEDFDGDKATTTAQIGGAITFKDDGPSAPTIVYGQNTQGYGTVDEDPTLPGGIEGGPGDDFGALSAKFSGTVVGDFGADGKAAANAYAFDVVDGASTGLTSLAGNAIVFKIVDAGHVEGRDSLTDELIFTVAMDASTGQFDFELKAPIQHPGHDDGFNENGIETAWEDNLFVNIGVKITDGDGDSAPGAIKISIDDDSPVAFDDTGVSVAENSGEQNLGSIADVLLANDKGGADGLDPASFQLLSGVGSHGGSLAIVNGEVVYTAPVNVDNSKDPVTEEFTYQIADKDGDLVTAKLVVTITDANLPDISVQSDIHVDEDGLPGGNAGGTGDDDANAGEEAPVNPNEAIWHGKLNYDFGLDGKGDVLLSTNVGGANGTGLTDLAGNPIVTSYDAATHTLTGYVESGGAAGLDAGDTKMFTLVVNDIDTGDFTMTLLQPVKHPLQDPNGNFEDNLGLPIDIKVTDKDGSFATGQVTLDIDDDAPAVYSISTAGEGIDVIDETIGGQRVYIVKASVDEDFLPGGNQDLPSPSAGDGPGKLSPSGNFGVGFGADGAASDPFALETVTDAALAGIKTSEGHALKVLTSTGDLIEVVDATDGTPVFKLTMDNSGNWQFTLQHGLQQGGAPNVEDGDITLDFLGKAFDKDGDYAMLPIRIVVDDDIPSVPDQHNDGPQTEGGFALVDEDELVPNGNKDSASGDDAGLTKATGSVTAAFGGDGKGSFGFDGISEGADSNLDTDDGKNVLLHIATVGDQQIVTGYADDGVPGYQGTETSVFTLALNVAGADIGKWEFNLLQPVSHPTLGTEDNINVSFGIKIADADGDTQTGAIKISIDDDMPKNVSVTDFNEQGFRIDEDFLPGGNQDADGAFAHGDDAGGVSTSGTVHASFGADRPGHFELAYAGPDDVAFTDAASNQVYLADGTTAVMLHRIDANHIVGYAGDPSNVVFDLTLNPASGVFVFELKQALLEAPGGDGFEDNLAVKFGALAVDADGDAVGTTFTITIDDDVPQIPTSRSDGPATTAGYALVDEDFLAAGNHDLDALPGENGDDAGNTHASGQFNVNYGGDGPGSFGFDAASIKADADTGLDTLDGHNVLMQVSTNGSHQIVSGIVDTDNDGKIDNGESSEVFKLDLDTATGKWTFDLEQAVKHPDTNNNPADDATDDGKSSFEDNVNLSFGVKITDKEGDAATGAIKISIDDDGPVANNDTNSVNSGFKLDISQALGVESNDGFGADGKLGSGVVGVSKGTNTASPADATKVGVDLLGDFGTLHLNADGSYTYQAQANVSGVDHFVYTIEDVDGDTSTAHLDITVSKVGPAPASSAVTVDEAALDTTKDPNDLAASLITGSNPGSPDETKSSSLGLPAGVTVVGGTQDVLGVFGSLHINADGTYTYTLTKNYLNPVANDGVQTINGVETFNLTVQDAGGNTAAAQITVNVIDDVPSVNVTKGAEAGIILATQDAQTIGAASDTAVSSANFSNVFAIGSSGFGADGAGTAPSLSYSLGFLAGFTEGSVSGLTIGGTAIRLYESGGVITGSTAATEGGINAGNTVFTVSVSGTGVVTLTQLQQIDHSVAEGAPAYDDDQKFLSNGQIGLTASATITDKDGDTASDSETIDLGGNLRFDDDGPSVDVTKGAEAGIVLATQDAQTIGAASDTAVSSANFSNVFAIGSSGFGADGAGTAPSLSYSLGFLAGFTEGSVSGLTIGGTAIRLYESGGVITGSTAATEGGINAGNTVFTVSVSGTGVVTLTQLQQIDHSVAEGAPAYDDDQKFLSNGQIGLTASATITDKDGDTASDSETIDLGGNLRFDDDGPVANNDTNSVNSGFKLDISQALGVELNDGFGADGKLGSGVVGVSKGTNTASPADATKVGVDLLGDFGTLHLNADGSYTYQAQANVSGVDHFVYTIEDVDGDTSTAHLDITVSKVGPAPASSAVTVDEAALDTTKDPNDLAASLITGSNPGSPDETKSSSLGLPAGVTVVGGTQDVLGVFGSLHINADGTYTYTLTKNYLNPVANDGVQTINGVETFNLTVQDAGGNTAAAQITVNVIDDVPSVNVTKGAEAGIILATQDAQTIGAASDTAVSSANFSNVFAIGSSGFGADGAGTAPSLSYSLGFLAGFTEGSVSGLTIGGTAIRLYESGGVITGSTAATEGGINAGNTVFTVSVSGTGVVTLTQLQQIDHSVAEGAPAYDDDQKFLSNGQIGLTASATITDKDGDTASDSETIDLGGNLRFDDDGPSVDVTKGAEAGIVLATQDAQTIGAASDTAVSSANFSNVFAIGSSGFGADGAGTAPSLSYSLGFLAGFTEGSVSGLTIGGTAIRLYESGGVITGSTAATEGGINAGNTVFTVSVSGTGVVTLTQLQQIDHSVAEGAPAYDDDQKFLSNGQIGLTASATITDKDGDTASDSETIDLGGNLRFDDDGPVANNDTNSVNSGFKLDISQALGVESNDGFGADGKLGSGVVGVSKGTNTASPADATKVGVDLLGDFGTLHLNADGSYTYQAQANVSGVDHFVYTIEDVDGDTSTAHLDITVSKVGPAPASSAVTVDEAALDTTKDPNDLAASLITGSNPGSPDETKSSSLGLPAGVTVVGGTQDVLGVFGSLHINADGTYTYTLTKNYLNPVANDGVQTINGVETFNLTVQDAGGNTAAAQITVNVMTTCRR